MAMGSRRKVARVLSAWDGYGVTRFTPDTNISLRCAPGTPGLCPTPVPHSQLQDTTDGIARVPPFVAQVFGRAHGGWVSLFSLYEPAYKKCCIAALFASSTDGGS